MNKETTEKRPQQIAAISLFTLLFSMAVAGILLVVPAVATSILNHTHSHETEKWILAQASTYQSIFFAIAAIGCVLFLPVIGRVTDLFGRKPVILASAIALAAAVVALFMAFFFNQIWLVLLAGVFMVCEGSAQVAGMAFVTDIWKTKEERSTYFGVIVGLSCLGVVVGSLLFGWLGDYGTKLSLIVIFGVSVVDAIVVAVLLQEIKEEVEFIEMREKEGLSMNPFRVVKLVLTTSVQLTAILICYSLFNIATADTNADYLYTQYRYGWGPKLNGIQVAVASMSTVVWQLVGVRLLVKYVSDGWMMIIILLLSTISNVGYGLATTGWMFMTISAIGGFATIFIPLSEVYMSKQINEKDQGSLFGGMISINFISQFLGDLIIENSFSLCLRGDGFFSCPGTPFYIGTILLFIALVICLVLFTRRPSSEEKYLPLNAEV